MLNRNLPYCVVSSTSCLCHAAFFQMFNIWAFHLRVVYRSYLLCLGKKYSIFRHHIFLFHFILIVSVIINENLDTGFVKLSSLPVSAVQLSSQMRPWWAGSPADTKGPAMCFCSWRVAKEFDKDVKHTHIGLYILFANK